MTIKPLGHEDDIVALCERLETDDMRDADPETAAATIRSLCKQLDTALGVNVPGEVVGDAIAEREAQSKRRDREADRQRFTDPAFNRWLDEVISDSGHTVWDQIGSVVDAWAGWENREHYTADGHALGVDVPGEGKLEQVQSVVACDSSREIPGQLPEPGASLGGASAGLKYECTASGAQ